MNEHDRQVAEAAWDKGRAFGALPQAEQGHCVCPDPAHHERNPYRVSGNPASPKEGND